MSFPWRATGSIARSSIRFPGKKLGRAAVELLFRMMNGDPVAVDVRVSQTPRPIRGDALLLGGEPD